MRKDFLYGDYDLLCKISEVSSNLPSLAVKKNLNDIGVYIGYDPEEHMSVWQKVKDTCNDCLDKRHGTNLEFIVDYIYQFSPNENKYDKSNQAHILRYVRQAVEVSKVLPKQANVVDFASNAGIASLALKVLGFNVVCTDLEHSLIGEQQVSYKSGAWIRRHFLGMPQIDSFLLGTDNFEQLKVFDGGIDGFITRSGVELFSLVPFVRMKKSDFRRRFKRLSKFNIDWFPRMFRLYTAFENYKHMLSHLNPGGIIYEFESGYFNYPDVISTDEDTQKKLLEKLKVMLKPFCAEYTYTVANNGYSDIGWQMANTTIFCRK